MIPQGIPIFLALQPVDMRLGFERLGALVRERMEHNPRSRALFAFVGKRGNTMKILTWDGSGVVLVHKKLDAGKFEIPKPTHEGEQHIVVSDAIFDVIFAGVPIEKRVRRRRRIH